MDLSWRVHVEAGQSHTVCRSLDGRDRSSGDTARRRTIVAAAFEIRSGMAPRPSEMQPPVRLTDLHYGDPATSSVRYEGETAWSKPHVDVLLNGSAHARSGKPAEAVEVRLRLGPLDKRLLVSGDRTWSGGPGRSPGRPKPFTSMPIVYERAFGGAPTNQSHPSVDTRNPVGVGFNGSPSADPEVVLVCPTSST